MITSLNRWWHRNFGSSWVGPHERLNRLRKNHLYFSIEHRTVLRPDNQVARTYDFDHINSAKEGRRKLIALIDNAAELSTSLHSTTRFGVLFDAKASLQEAIMTNTLSHTYYETLLGEITGLILIHSATNSDFRNDPDYERLTNIVKQYTRESTGERRKVTATALQLFFDLIPSEILSFEYYIIALGTISRKHAFEAFHNYAIRNYADQLLLCTSLIEQKRIFEHIKFTDEDIFGLYVRKAVELNKRTKADIVRCGLSNALQQIGDFVTNGKALGVLAGIEHSGNVVNSLERGRIVVNQEHPAARRVRSGVMGDT